MFLKNIFVTFYIKLTFITKIVFRIMMDTRSKKNPIAGYMGYVPPR
jgi:hypothetical protein